MKNMSRSYVLITPARNEEAYIEATIKAVIGQTILPMKWIIVSDGSTDRTEAIVQSYSRAYDFIELVTAAGLNQRSFGSKALAFKAGYERLGGVPYDFVGNTDADVSFDSDYYRYVLEEFEKQPNLGIAGGIIIELVNGTYVAQNISLNSVAGAVQLFRRQCYEDIGGYLPLKHGGIDAAAEIMARFKGWDVRTFPEVKVRHLRRVGTEKGSLLATRFHHGTRDYLLGYHPLFYLMMNLYRLMDRPFILHSLLRMCGYCWGKIRRMERTVPDEFVDYLRKEQMMRVRSLFIRNGGLRSVNTSRITGRF